jgi:hypothetical protein
MGAEEEPVLRLRAQRMAGSSAREGWMLGACTGSRIESAGKVCAKETRSSSTNEKESTKMSWSLNFNGSQNDIGEQFDIERKQAAANGMIVAEQRDIDEARNFAMQIASQYGDVKGFANGSWNTRTNVPSTPSSPGGTVSSFGKISITIEAGE